MNESLIKELHQSKGKPVIYFKNKKLNTKEHDLMVYKVLNHYLQNNHLIDDAEKYEQIDYLTKVWFYTLIRLEHDRKEEKCDVDETAEPFYQSFLEETKNLTNEEKNEVLYRMPWHLRMLGWIQNEKTIHRDFIENVASLENLDTLRFSDTNYFQLTKVDKWAIQTIEDEIKEHHQDLLRFQLEENLPSISYYMDHFTNFIQKKIPYEEKDQQGLNIMAYLFLEFHQKEAKEKNLFDFFAYTMSSICFWHMEATETTSNWFIKEGKFQFFKRHKKDMLGM